MFNARLIRRQITGSLRQSVIFVLCVILSMVTLVSLGSFSRSVHMSLLRDSRVLHAADIIIRGHAPFSLPLIAAVDALQRKKEIDSSKIYNFYSVVQSADGEGSLLADIKVVEPGYPFYGLVELASLHQFSKVLSPGSIIVEQILLDRLHLVIGDRLRVGSVVLTIRDVVTAEPDRPVNFFALGPRVFVASADLASLGLVDKGSRVGYTILAKVHNQNQLENITDQLRAAAVKDREQVETFQNADSRVKRFFDNLLFFLNLIGIFTVLLAGIGIQSTLTALFKEQERSIAIMKAVGAPSRFIISHYFVVIAILGLTGTLLGIVASFILQEFLPELFRGLLPVNLKLSIAGSDVIEGFLLGFTVVVLFTALPLYRLKELKPLAIFGKEEQSAIRSRSSWFTGAALILFFIAMIFLRIRELKTGLSFVLGIGGLIIVVILCADGVLYLLKSLQTKNLILRQALKGLFRPRNATRAIIITLTASLAVIFSITLIEKNLEADFVHSYPPDAPNLYFIDIQPAQKDAFAQTLGIATIYHPIIRAMVTAVDGEPIDQEQELRKRGDNLSREFNLTYRHQLLEDERIVLGKELFRKDWSEVQVSVLDTVVKMREMRIGDTLTFRIQGIPVEARISSIRTRTRTALQPYFYFVFPEEVLKDAPQTFFAAVRVEKKLIAPLQNRIVARFPNVSVIDLTETVIVFGRVMGKVSAITRFFTLFSVIAGVLLIVSSIFATRHARIQEAVYYTILGARRRFIVTVFAVESLFLGLISGFISLALAQTGSYIVCRNVLDVIYRPFFGTSLLLILATILLVIVIGAGASASILRQKPAAFLREQAEE